MEFTKYYEKSLKRWLEGVFLKKFDLSKGVEMGGENMVYPNIQRHCEELSICYQLLSVQVKVYF